MSRSPETSEPAPDGLSADSPRQTPPADSTSPPKTPIGSLSRAMLGKLPELNARSAQLTQARLQTAVPEVNKLLADMTAELEKQKP